MCTCAPGSEPAPRGSGSGRSSCDGCANSPVPGAALLVTWMALGSFVGWYFGVEGFGRVVKLVVSPLWFLGVYLMLIALLPVSLWLHRRYGVLVLVWLAGLAMSVDVARFHYQIEDVGWINMLLIWTLAHQAGFFYDTVVKAPRQIDLSLLWGGLFGLVGLVFSGLYPGSMVGVPGERFSNMAPPTFVMVALLLFQIGAVEVLRPAMTDRLDRPRWRTVNEVINRFALPLFLFHTTGMAIARFLSWRFLGDDLQDKPVDAVWWATRPLAVIFPLLCTLPVIYLFGRRWVRAPRSDRDLTTVDDMMAADPTYGWITLTTDYGLSDGFVAACHGVIARRAPAVRVLDVTHLVPPGDIRRGSAVLAQAVPHLPPAVHVAVVDPGVGTARRGVALEAGPASSSVLTTACFRRPRTHSAGVRRAVALDEVALDNAAPRYLSWLPGPVSATFHGRDIFAPVAAAIATGMDIADAGRKPARTRWSACPIRSSSRAMASSRPRSPWWTASETCSLPRPVRRWPVSSARSGCRPLASSARPGSAVCPRSRATPSVMPRRASSWSMSTPPARWRSPSTVVERWWRWRSPRATLSGLPARANDA